MGQPTPSKPPRPWTDSVVAELVSSLTVDKSTLYRRALGLPVRGRRAQLIDRAIDERGLVRFQPTEQPKSAA